MKTSIFPKTPSGKLSVKYFIAFVLLGIAGSLISNMTGNTIEYPNPINSPLLGSVIYLAFILAAVSFFTGLKAFFKSGERSLILYLVVAFCGYFSIGGFMMLLIGTFQSLF